MKDVILKGLGLSVCLGAAASVAQAEMMDVIVTVENLAPANGSYQAPFWVGFHDGSFDYFDAGSAASMEVERMAEDGNVSPLAMSFAGASGTGADAAIAPGGPFAPGATASATLTIDTDNPNSRYLSFASMLVPSNDAFVGNDDAMAHEIVDVGGNFIGADIIIMGSQVWDAGTEVNDEIPMNTAFLGQMTPDTGVDENGVVHSHPGFQGSEGFGGPLGNILGDDMFANADFTVDGYQVARITVRPIPAPGALAIFGAAGLVGGRRRRHG